jgi:hypothetical protein
MAGMTDLIGPRLSGSAGAAAAVTRVADATRKLGAKATLQPRPDVEPPIGRATVPAP